MSDFPRRFGPYLLLKPLARGGMGALYVALSGSEETAKLCVIKTVLPHLADKEYLQRFRDEAKVVVRLSHGNLVPVFDSGQADGEIYLAMDYIDGKDLRATWNRCAQRGIAFPVDVAAHIVKELARGLHYAHTFGSLKLVHRDVSPPNVLLSYSGEVKLTDFGLAASTLKLEKTAPGIIYGKVSYMSPEQARGEPLDGRTDLYAAGILLWELLTGRQLFPSGKAGAAAGGDAGRGEDAPTAEELLQRVRNPEIAPPSRRASRVPAELDRIVLKALAPDLHQRYLNCEELRRDLAAFLAHTSPTIDGVRISKFLSELYGEDIETDRRQREELIEAARKDLTSPPKGEVKVVPAGAAAAAAAAKAALGKGASPPPPPPPGKPAGSRPPPPPSAPTAPLPPSAGDAERAEARRQRGTVVAGRGRQDRGAEGRGGAQAAAALAVAPSADSSGAPEERSLTGDTEALSASVVGTVVDARYRVKRLCGEGGMGRVYEAEHIEIGKRVALKILHPAYSQTPDLVERLKREARAAGKISHPNVVDVTDSGTTRDGAFFFVMEFIEGIELGELIFREGRLEIARSLAIAAQVARALHAAHQVNVIHRDLKPENVLILKAARDGQRDFVKVLDFGIAKSGADGDDQKDSTGRPSRRLTHPGMTMGTPEYMAPEQATGRPADPRSDIYALGGILYEMLSGKPPYEGSNFMEILHKKANQMPPVLSTIRPDIPPEVEALITRAMAKDPAARPQSMEELEREIQHIASAWFPGQVRNTDQDLLPVRLSGFGLPPVLLPATAPATAPAVGPWARLRRSKRGMAIAGGAGLVVVAAVIAAISARGAPAKLPAAPPLAPVPVVAVMPAAPPAPAPPAPEVEAKDGDKKDQPEAAEAPAAAEPAPSRAGPGSSRAARAAAAAAVAAENRKMLEEGERMLRAERFPEARQIFSKLAKSRKDRGVALVGLAEISFQEKKYTEAVQSAQRAVADRGGGVRARVLLGDAHYRLNQFKEAAKAYEAALKLDPKNASARSGLALATKRM